MCFSEEDSVGGEEKKNLKGKQDMSILLSKLIFPSLKSEHE